VYTSPEDHFCPVCGIHLRSKDGHNDAEHILKPMCPVCKDIQDKADAYEREAGWYRWPDIDPKLLLGVA
jgi:hypothetical protein